MLNPTFFHPLLAGGILTSSLVACSLWTTEFSGDVSFSDPPKLSPKHTRGHSPLLRAVNTNTLAVSKTNISRKLAPWQLAFSVNPYRSTFRLAFIMTRCHHARNISPFVNFWIVSCYFCSCKQFCHTCQHFYFFVHLHTYFWPWAFRIWGTRLGVIWRRLSGGP